MVLLSVSAAGYCAAVIVRVAICGEAVTLLLSCAQLRLAFFPFSWSPKVLAWPDCITDHVQVVGGSMALCAAAACGGGASLPPRRGAPPCAEYTVRRRCSVWREAALTLKRTRTYSVVYTQCYDDSEQNWRRRRCGAADRRRSAAARRSTHYYIQRKSKGTTVAHCSSDSAGQLLSDTLWIGSDYVLKP